MVKTISSWRGGSACAETATLISSQDQLRIIAFNSHHAVLDDKPVLEEPARGARIDHMLLAQHTRGQLIRPLLGPHRQRCLDNDRSAIELRGHKMHRAAVHLDPGCERARMRIKSGEGGKQGRMDVEHAIT